MLQRPNGVKLVLLERQNELGLDDAGLTADREERAVLKMIDAEKHRHAKKKARQLSPHARDEDGWTALHWASRKGEIHTVTQP